MNSIQRNKDNIFPGAWDAIEDWDKFRWHRGAYQNHSSQALAIDFFGTLKVSTERNQILNSLAKKVSLPSSEHWNIELEWRDDDNLLQESPRARTQVDAIAVSDRSLVFFECKFTEEDGGSCSQPIKDQCNHNYEEQINPFNNIGSKCALSGKCIRYWVIIPHLFNFDSTKEYRPCLFSGPWYQWMRNLVVCSEVAKKRCLTPRFLIVYVDAPKLPMADNVNSGRIDEFKKTLREDVRSFDFVSYQNLLKMSIEATKTENAQFRRLNEWIDRKITDYSSKK